MGDSEGGAGGKLDSLHVVQPTYDLQGLRTLPWWWVYAKNLLTRFQGIADMRALSADGKTMPPRDSWLDDDELEEWKHDQEELRKMQQS